MNWGLGGASRTRQGESKRYDEWGEFGPIRLRGIEAKSFRGSQKKRASGEKNLATEYTESVVNGAGGRSIDLFERNLQNKARKTAATIEKKQSNLHRLTVPKTAAD